MTKFKEHKVKSLCEHCNSLVTFTEVQIGNEKDGYEGTGEYECSECEELVQLKKCEHCEGYVEEDLISIRGDKKICSYCEDSMCGCFEEQEQEQEIEFAF